MLCAVTSIKLANESHRSEAFRLIKGYIHVEYIRVGDDALRRAARAVSVSCRCTQQSVLIMTITVPLLYTVMARVCESLTEVSNLQEFLK